MKKNPNIGLWRPQRLKELRQPARDLPSSEEFWSAFRERAARRPQEELGVYAGRPWFAPAFSMAMLLLLVGGIWFWMESDSSVAGGLQVEVLEAGAYSYMIWDDASGGGTLLWLMDTGSVVEGGS